MVLIGQLGLRINRQLQFRKSRQIGARPVEASENRLRSQRVHRVDSIEVHRRYDRYTGISP
jgi:hypothetical protein